MHPESEIMHSVMGHGTKMKLEVESDENVLDFPEDLFDTKEHLLYLSLNLYVLHC